MAEDDKIEELLLAAKDAGLQVESRDISYLDDERVVHYIDFPSGEFARRLSVSNQDRAEDILKTDLKNVSFLEEYEAIVKLDTGTIEALLTSRDLVGGPFVWRRLGLVDVRSRTIADQIDDEPVPKVLTCNGPNGQVLEISELTDELSILCGNARQVNGFSLKIFLDGPVEYKEAVAALETISDALFFQIEIERDVALSLRKTVRRRTPVQRPSGERTEDWAMEWPTFEYDRAPISLYWYAKSARGMPLLQFLAYYQVAEYYFPNFAKIEAVRSARKLLKNPSFRIDRESDLTKLVSSISGNGRIGSSEREQMKATVLEVLSEEEVADFFGANEKVAEHVKRKQKGITEKVIQLHRLGHDHRADIAEILYEIRCRIVHTKNDAENMKAEALLPFSEAETRLAPYTTIMQLVARHALIRSSSVLRKF